MTEIITFDNLDLSNRINLLRSLPSTWVDAVEIGVWQGDYMCNMSLHTSMFVTGIDPYENTESYKDPEDTSDPWVKDAVGDFNIHLSRYAYALANIRSTELRTHTIRRSRLVRAYGSEMLPYFEDNSIDFIYIDGEHSYEGVSRDMKEWWPKVRMGGILAGHDYNDTNPGTIRAVDEFGVQLATEKKFDPEFRITGTRPEWGDADAPSWLFIKKEAKDDNATEG